MGLKLLFETQIGILVLLAWKRVSRDRLPKNLFLSVFVEFLLSALANLLPFCKTQLEIMLVTVKNNFLPSF